MNRPTLKRLIVKGTVAYVAVFSLVLMVAMPAMALIAARNSVNRRSIINGEVTYKDLAKNSVRTAKIAPKAVRYGKIASGAVRGNHIKDGHVKSADIGNGTILNADISSGAGIADSKISYSTKTGYLSIPVAALDPVMKTYDYVKLNGYLYIQTPGVGTFHAPVQLPQGALITKLRFDAFDDGPHYTYAKLRRISNFDAASTGLMATLTTFGTANSSSRRPMSTTAITDKIVDNNNYAYRVEVHLSGTGASWLNAGNIVIDYTYTSPGS